MIFSNVIAVDCSSYHSMFKWAEDARLRSDRLKAEERAVKALHTVMEQTTSGAIAFASVSALHSIAHTWTQLVNASKPTPVFVINLNQSVVRKHLIKRQLEAARMDWQRIPAILGRDVRTSVLQAHGLMHGRGHPNNVASALSHLQIWHWLARGYAPAAIILEDDAILGRNFKSRANRLMQRCINNDCDLVSLSWFRHLTPHPCVHELGDSQMGHSQVVDKLVELRCPPGRMQINPGVTAYVLTSRGARRAVRRVLPIYGGKHGSNGFDLTIGSPAASEGNGVPFRWFAVQREQSLVRHNYSLRSVRVHGVRRLSIQRVQ